MPRFPGKESFPYEINAHLFVCIMLTNNAIFSPYG